MRRRPDGKNVSHPGARLGGAAVAAAPPVAVIAADALITSGRSWSATLALTSWGLLLSAALTAIVTTVRARLRAGVGQRKRVEGRACDRTEHGPGGMARRPPDRAGAHCAWCESPVDVSREGGLRCVRCVPLPASENAGNSAYAGAGHVAERSGGDVSCKKILRSF